MRILVILLFITCTFSISCKDESPVPVIRSFEPRVGEAGDTIIIYGSGLTDRLTIKFNNIEAKIVADSKNSISVIVPEMATTGPLTLFAEDIINLGYFEVIRIYNGPTALESQKEIDNLSGQHYTHYPSGLYISGQSVNSLKPLLGAKDFYDLGIYNAPNLLTLDGLDSLKIIENEFYIIANSSLSSIEAIENLTSVGDLFLHENEALKSLEGLNSLEEVKDDFFIDGNHSLKDLNGLNSLGILRDTAIIYGNSNLISLDGLESLKSVARFSVALNFNLQNIDALSGLETIEKLLSLEGSSSIANINALSHLKNINGVLNIYDLDLLTNIDGLSNLESVGGLHLTNNALTNLDGLHSLRQAGIGVFIKENESLIDFCGLESLLENVDFTGEFEVEGNAYNPAKQEIIDGNCRLDKEASPIVKLLY